MDLENQLQILTDLENPLPKSNISEESVSNIYRSGELATKIERLL